MNRTIDRRSLLALGAGAAVTFAAAPARAEQISVTHWGALMYGVPYAVAMDRGFFRQAGLNVDGILTSQGGGTTVRNVLAGGLPYGEVSLAAAIAAIREGIDIAIVNAGARSVADALWVVMPNSDIRTIRDLVGRKMAITSPRSVTDQLSIMVLEASGIPLNQVERPALGGVGAGLAALESGAVQAAPIFDPIWSARAGRYRALFSVKDILPPMTQTVGIVTREFARTRPDAVRAIVAGRRQGVDFIHANPAEAGRILARSYDNLRADVAERAVRNMIEIDYWSRGNFEIAAMNEMVRGLRIIGEVQGEIDWSRIIDRSFLPADLQGQS